eukprot:CAMPEP_0195080586 /NCGR_PEP_ID=MMETSP0448-20130528/22259_1 /TAXON_ID=66468 /ORGANISM="Heterocapsa triquestra, Strain CCMP 448" /LENGTH=96 /DNA_ID=CAMNT_0040113545 /DNA_START=13 /DNA_END=299 /DNA_ORIENTATION=-
MSAQVNRHFPDLRHHSRVQFRTGAHYELEELQKVSAASAQNIFILGHPGDSRRSDLMLVRTVVSLASLPGLPRGTIVGEVMHLENSAVLRTILPNA